MILRYYLGIRMEGLKKNMKNINQNSGSRGRESNPGPHEYEAGALITLA
jgi:hypothetical protein